MKAKNLETYKSDIAELKNLMHMVSLPDTDINIYIKYEEKLRELDFPVYLIKELYMDCKFASWQEFHEQKKIDLKDKRVQYTIANIRGATKAILNKIKFYINTMTQEAIHVSTT